MELPLKKNAKVLDVGCGYGHISLFLKKQGFQVIGIDSCKEMVENAKGKFDCRLMNAESIEFPDNSFDLVLSDGLLEHFKSPEKILMEQKRVSKNYAVNFIPSNFLINRVLESLQGTPEVFWKSKKEWIALHELFFSQVKTKKLLRLNAFICRKQGKKYDQQKKRKPGFFLS